ncbi:MAG: ROK family protein [Hyphomicrobiaceae bacterium]
MYEPEACSPPAPGTSTIGIDLGGTKIEAIVLSPDGAVLARRRVATPRQDYDGTLRAITALSEGVRSEADLAAGTHVGVAMPGSIPPASGRVQNANSTWLNGRPFGHDLARTLAAPVRLANDANCFALSELCDGAGRGANSLFGIILGTGCGGGVVYQGMLIDGLRGIGGEWGHNPLPWAEASEHPGPRCWCGRDGCLETWISGPGLAADHARETGITQSAEAIVASAAGSPLETATQAARATLARHASRLARGLAHVVNLIDPDVVVIGGGLCRLAHLYDEVPRLAAPFIFADDKSLDLRPPVHGDASGARGAARLWQLAR